MGAGCGEEFCEFEGPDFPVWFSIGTPRRLQELSEVFTLVWATNWEDRANLVLAPALGIEPLPVIYFATRRGRPGQSLKLGAVKAFAGNQPLAWLDDEVGDDMLAWARERRVPTLVRTIYPRVGMSDGDVAALLRFHRQI
jgi:hypothetical protein